MGLAHSAPDTALHVTYRLGGDAVMHHNCLLRSSCTSVKGSPETLTTPPDLLTFIAGWDRGKPAALDITMTSSPSHHHHYIITITSSPSNHPFALYGALQAPHKCHRGLAGPAFHWQWRHMAIGAKRPPYLLQAGIPPGHSPVLPQVNSCGCELWWVDDGSELLHC